MLVTGVHSIIADGLKSTEERLVPVKNGEYVKEAKIGSAIMDADIVISLAHFKGHELAGFGGAIKNVGMGSGSRAGKMEMHCSGKPHVDTALCIGCGKCRQICAHSAPEITDRKAVINHDKCVGCGRCIAVCTKDAVLPPFDEANDVMNYKMAEYTQAVVQDRPAFYINLVVDVSPFCDCHAENDTAIIPNVGFFCSFDPIALDKACVDAVNAQAPNPGSLLAKNGSSHHEHFTDVSPDSRWLSALQHGEKIGLGHMEYKLITVK